MSWTSTPITSSKSKRPRIGDLPAVLVSGLGSGMLLALCLHFGNKASGSSHLISSWLPAAFMIGACLGLLWSDRWIQSGRIHRWGLLGWAGLVTGIQAWLQPMLATFMDGLWVTSTSAPFGWLMAAAATSLTLGAIPGLFAGTACGAGCHSPLSPSNRPQHDHDNRHHGRLGWVLVTASSGFGAAYLFFHPFFGLEFSVPMTALVWLLTGAGGLIAKAGSILGDRLSSDPETSADTASASGQQDRMWLYLGIMGASALTVWLRFSDWVWGDIVFWHVCWSCLALTAIGLGFLFPSGTKQPQSNGTVWGLGIYGLLTFALLYFYEPIPFWLVDLKQKLTGSTGGFTVHAFLYISLFGGIIFIPMYGLGCLAQHVGPRKMIRSHFVRLLITGSIAWIMLRHVLIPGLGLSRMAVIPAASTLALAVFLLLQQRPKWAGMSRLASSILFVLIVSYAGSKFEHAWRLAFSQADDLSTGFFRTKEHSMQWAYRSDQIYYREDPQGTVAIHSYDYPEDSQLELRINGEVIERGYVHQIKPVLNTMIPYVLHGRPQQVAIFGLRAGMTAGIFASMPTVQQLDGIEPRTSLREVIASFSASNGKLLERTNFRYHPVTPVNFLRANSASYDVIINQYARPWRSMDVSTFTLEFYEQCRDHLGEDGLMIQNLQLSHLDDPTIETVVATFGSVFPQTSIWNIGHGEHILIGTATPRSWPMETLQQRIQQPEVQSVLQTQGLEIWPMLLTTQITSFENGFHLVPDESIMHSIEFPSLRVTATRAHPAPDKPLFFEDANEQFQANPPLLLSEYSRHADWSMDQMRALSLLQMDQQFFEPAVFRSIVRRWLESSPEETALHLLSASTSNAESEWAFEAARLRSYIRTFSAEEQPPLDLIKQTTYQVLMAYRGQRTIFHQPNTELLSAMLQHLIEADPANQRVYRMNLVELAWDKQDDASFQQYSKEAFDPDETLFGPADFSADPLAPHRTLSLMAEYWWRRGQLDRARDICIQAVQARYIGPDATFHDPALERVVRKILFAMDLTAETKNENANQLELESITPTPQN
ncbi:MAG: hypothetical protein ACFHW5_12545 [Verrucomicrobiota bacterium]